MLPDFVVRLFFDANVRRKIYLRLAAQLENNISLERALELMRDRFMSRKSPLASVFEEIIHKYHQGQTLDMALEGLVPPEESMLLRGGAKSGRLWESLSLCAELIEARKNITASVVDNLGYPLVFSLCFLGLLLVISVYVVPELALISDPRTWQGGAAVLYKASSFVGSPWGLGCLALLVLGGVASLVSLPLWTGNLRLLVEEIPPWSFYRLVTGSIWLFTVATLLRASIQLNTILEDMLASGRLRPWLAERVDAVLMEHAKGKNIGEALATINMRFPDTEMVEDLAILAGLPGFDDRLYALSRSWLQDGIRIIHARARTLNTVCISALMGLMCLAGMAVSSLRTQLLNTGVM